MSEATRALDEETKRTGELSVEYKDVTAFLANTRNIFISLEVYPEKYAGLFGVTRGALSLAREQMNQISAKHANNYPEEILKPIATDLGKLNDAILEMETNALDANRGPEWRKKTNRAKAKYEKLRDELKRSLEEMEAKSQELRAKSEEEVLSKWNELKARESNNAILLFVVGAIYLALISFLGFSTHKSLASPLRNLEKAAKDSIDHNKPFTMAEIGPYEIRSLTRRLQGLILGLEEKVEQRTSDLKEKTIQLQAEIHQRMELESQLIHAQKMEAVGQLASGIAHEINSPSQFANDNILFLKDAVEGFIAEIDKTDKAPDEKEILFLKENAPQAVEQASEGIGRITTIVKSM